MHGERTRNWVISVTGANLRLGPGREQNFSPKLDREIKNTITNIQHYATHQHSRLTKHASENLRIEISESFLNLSV